MDGSGVSGAKGWIGLGAIGVVAGIVSGVAEALGKVLLHHGGGFDLANEKQDLGQLDDNLTLPIISGGCILVFFKLIAAFT